MARRSGAIGRCASFGAAAIVLATGACAADKRAGATADSAVLHSAALDSARRAGDGAPAVPAIADTSASDRISPDSTLASGGVFVLLADSAAGDSLYRRGGLCLTCHGVRGEGVPNLGPDLRDSVWLTGDGSVAAIERIIVEGVAEPKALRVRMPSFGRLPQGDARRIAAYVYTLSHPGMAHADTASLVDSIIVAPPGAAPAP